MSADILTEAYHWQRLQNGSDIRGVALEGVAGEAVNLTPAVTYRLGQAFVAWLAKKLNKAAADLVVSVGRDSRLSGPALISALGADTTGSQFLDPDGNFPNHIPNPENAEAMASICKAVLDNGADFGIIFDTDVDRSAAVDSQGNELNRNRLIALISAVILREHPGSTIVTDSITSDGLATFIEGLGGVHHRFKRGYKNVINEAIILNEAGQESWLAIETSGHGAMKENYYLDDGAYLVSKLLGELAIARQSGKVITGLIAELKEPEESQEYRLKILAEDFQAPDNAVIQQLHVYVEEQNDWQAVPSNYEGIRVACTDEKEKGWFLLRLSLHDPVLPLNIESNVKGGGAQIRHRLLTFFTSASQLDISSIEQ